VVSMAVCSSWGYSAMIASNLAPSFHAQLRYPLIGTNRTGSHERTPRRAVG